MTALLKNRHVLSLTGNGVMAVFSLLTYLILYRFLAAADMGNWVFFQFVFLLLDTFRTGLLQTALIKFYSGADEGRKRRVAGSAWYIALLVTGTFGVLNCGTLPFADGVSDVGVRLALGWFGLSLAATLPYNVSIWLLQAEQRFDRILCIRLLNQGSFIGLVFGLYVLQRLSLSGVVQCFLLSSLLTSVVTVAAGWARLGALRYKTAADVRELFRFGKYSFGTFLGANLLRSSDAFIVKFMLGPAALAIYNLPTRLLEIIEVPLRSGLATAMPSMSAALNQGREADVANLLKKYTVLLTLLFVPLIAGALVFADVIVGFIGGGKYVGTEAANLYRIMMVCSLLFPLERFLGVTLDIINKPQLNLVKVILALAVNVLADLVCIKLLGNVYGAALASVFTLVASTAYGYVALRRYLPLRFRGALGWGLLELRSSSAGLVHKAKLLRL
ncbi:oligosaccharide flippase family protein [Hymenobacter sp. BT770]|uniref:oligosaccharide flippase family protein n=1 Tax=Hymenobacter sp. BT770 TaxID=2886942 RepID=UPI001D10E9B6|nr:oligosaccharide flippase family protein [Hymenobacter sp. BT770]MCC3155137.1 oligosaccharide flippase family protein [Hymenobacter sp. BT770]MDO3417140.1 oligosaccharide flippase family protein [Hymenobacter sp. BT770]